ncbi:hypothetical protein [Paenibacillus sp. B2(2019)]|uniref:hypothetical protein n=1 Tax=Paenibacillus sp. B2(2019) TaxID=2607754 RepID=UPI0011F21EC2|nr:hypothetical protein [Paenibacillus sp. B2(2019)]KAA1190347.1 hypothetical protein PAENI_06180 [Paenibacillus sp. B2(2019)]
MGWGRMPIRGVVNEYNDEVKKIDEQILTLIQERKAITGKKRFSPESEVLEEWSTRFEMDTSQIVQYIHSLNEAVPRRKYWEEPGLLLGVLPIVKRIVLEDCEYTLTHAMQYEALSIVTVEIKYLKETVEHVHLRAALTLEIMSEAAYEIQPHGGHGGGAHTQMKFLVWPPLPTDLDTVQFSLIPGEDRMFGPSMTEIILDKQVDFE